MSSKPNSGNSVIISDSTSLSMTKQPSKPIQINEQTDSKAQTDTKVHPQSNQKDESKNSAQMVINTVEPSNEESVISDDSDWWVNPFRSETISKAKPNEEGDDILKKQIETGEVTGVFKHHSPTRKYEPMRAIDRLLNSHLRTKVSDRTSQNSTETKTSKDLNSEEKAKPINIPNLVEPKKVTVDVDVEVDHVTPGIPEWMVKPRDKLNKKDRVKPGLECVDKLRKFFIYDNITIIDSFTNSKKFTKNWMTLRNNDFQQLFHIGTENNHSLSTFRSFNLIIVDQYSRKVMSIKKYWKSFCCGRLDADIECPAGEVIGQMRQTRFLFNKTVEFIISDPKSKKKRFVIRRMADASIRYEFDILNSSLESIGTIVKRFEKIDFNRVVKEDHHIRVGVPQIIAPEDKAILICAGILINIFYLKRFKAIENK